MDYSMEDDMSMDYSMEDEKEKTADIFNGQWAVYAVASAVPEGCAVCEGFGCENFGQKVDDSCCSSAPVMNPAYDIMLNEEGNCFALTDLFIETFGEAAMDG